jgi:uncharacterized protein (DUF2252 family)
MQTAFNNSRAQGLEARKRLPRESQANWITPAHRPDPVDLLRAQEEQRVPELLPVRYGRMVGSPLLFFRGAAAMMAWDLASLPNSGLDAQLCGDCHLLNFGLYASPERTLLFDINDFDETFPGPFEWDIKRLAASLILAARNNAFKVPEARRAALSAVTTYRASMGDFAQMGNLEVWYQRISAEGIMRNLKTYAPGKAITKEAVRILGKAHVQDHLLLSKLAGVADGKLQIIEDPPRVARTLSEDQQSQISKDFASYAKSLQPDRRALLEQYRFADVAHKLVGVGSVGLRCFVILLEGRDEQDRLFLQLKQAEASVLEGYLPKDKYSNPGRRVAEGQRLMQAASDILLGWLHGVSGRDYYCRQLRDMKGSVVVERLTPAGLAYYAGVCGKTLARAHARSGDRVKIAAYLGRNDRFDNAIADFAETYADQTERDYRVLVDAVKSGKVEAQVGV